MNNLTKLTTNVFQLTCLLTRAHAELKVERMKEAAAQEGFTVADLQAAAMLNATPSVLAEDYNFTPQLRHLANCQHNTSRARPPRGSCRF